jgi:hypothetical protein
VLQGDASEAVDGTEANERLTAATGAAVILLLTVLGVTIINLRLLIWEHLFIGLVLIPPVVVKLASTGYRFMRYYTGNPVYARTPAIRCTCARALSRSSCARSGRWSCSRRCWCS